MKLPGTTHEPGQQTDVAAVHQGQSDAEGDSVPTRRSNPQSEARRAARLARFEAVKQLHAQGISQRAIGRQVGIDHATVRRWLRTDSFPERATRPRKASKLKPFVPYLEQQLIAGRHNGLELWRELPNQHHYMAPRKPAIRRHVSAQRAAWMLMRTPQDLEPDDEVFVQRLCQAEPEIGIAYQLAQEFRAIVRQRRARDLPNWLVRAEASGVRELRTFVARIGCDYQAVRLHSNWFTAMVQSGVTSIASRPSSAACTDERITACYAFEFSQPDAFRCIRSADEPFYCSTDNSFLSRLQSVLDQRI